jgi:hypothetical protein
MSFHSREFPGRVLSYLPPKDIRLPLRGSSCLAQSCTGEMGSVQNLSRNIQRERIISDPWKWTVGQYCKWIILCEPDY